MQQKDLRKLCARLREERLIASHTRAEIRDGSTRPVNREYYYIPLHPVIDAIKYKISKLTSTIKAQYTPSEERKEYICLRCGAEWTELDVLSLYSDEGFECQSCGAILERTEDVHGTEGVDRTGHEKNSKLMAQLDKMLKLLMQIDSVEIPPNDFDSAWDHKVDVVRNQRTHPARQAIAVPAKKQEAIRGNAKTDATALEVSLTSTEEKSAVEQADEAARKAAVEKQNALPVWHTHSTVSTAAGNVNNTTTAAATNNNNNNTAAVKPEPDVPVKPEIKTEETEERKPNADALDDQVAAYYVEMAKEQALQQAREDASTPDDEGSDEEFDEEFEDVGAVSGSNGPDTPASAPAPATANASATAGPTSAPAVAAPAPTPTPSDKPEPVAGVKRELDADYAVSSSAPQTTTATPSTSTPEIGEPAAKKVKVEDGPPVKKEDEVSDEDDEEFEDV